MQGCGHIGRLQTHELAFLCPLLLRLLDCKALLRPPLTLGEESVAPGIDAAMAALDLC